MIYDNVKRLADEKKIPITVLEERVGLARGMRKQSLREIMAEMTTAEIIGDFLRIGWYIAWRTGLFALAFLGLMYFCNWEWWR